MRLLYTFLCLFLISALLAPAAATAQEEMMEGPSEMEATMMMPGPEHELLKSIAGNWSTTFTYNMQPGAEGMKATCDDHAELIYGGKYIKYVSKITEGPFPGESTEYWGFDRRTGKYTYMRMDSNSNTWMTASGTYDKASNTINMEGSDLMPGPDGKFHQTPFTMQLKMHSKDKCSFKVDISDGQGGTFTMVEGTSNRK